MALQFFDRPHEHDGRRHIDRRAHVRFLSARFTTVAEELAGHPDAVPVDDRQGLGAAYRVEVEAHFSPFVDVLFHRTRLSRNALWRLVADAIAGRCLEVGRQLGCLEEAQAIGMEVVKQKGSPLYNRQLRYFDLTLHDDDRNPLGSWTFRARGGCCRFYTVTHGSLCSTCVLKNPAERDAELLQAMRAHAHLLVRGGK